MFKHLKAPFSDICQLVWLTKNTSYENVGGIFLRQIARNNLNEFNDVN